MLREKWPESPELPLGINSRTLKYKALTIFHTEAQLFFLLFLLASVYWALFLKARQNETDKYNNTLSINKSRFKKTISITNKEKVLVDNIVEDSSFPLFHPHTDLSASTVLDKHCDWFCLFGIPLFFFH